jgi:1-aminocyclopropane-1-carboxylate deaminase/D-cysteine desulfhydrase-like pyridoxal-dependent ACC family enzyme
LYLEENYPGTSIIPEGGAGEFGEKGAGEVLNDIDDSFDFVLCSVGTGSTFSGLLKHASNQNRKIQLEGYAIIKNGEYLGESFEKCAYQISSNCLVAKPAFYATRFMKQKWFFILRNWFNKVSIKRVPKLLYFTMAV